MDALSYDLLDEAGLIQALREGNEETFVWLVQKYHKSLVRLANLYLQDSELSEETAQDTWLAVLKSLDRFEGRSSFKTWLFTILANQAKTRGRREKPTLQFIESGDDLGDYPTVDVERFNPSDAKSFANHWSIKATPASWRGIPEEIFLSEELLDVIHRAIDSLPENQRAVMVLRDIEGFSSVDVCNILGISDTNLRVLLHRSRAKVREILEAYLDLDN